MICVDALSTRTELHVLHSRALDRIVLERPMSSRAVLTACVDCGAPPPPGVDAFDLISRRGWRLQRATPSADLVWRCEACARSRRKATLDEHDV